MSDAIANVRDKVILITGGAQGIGGAAGLVCAQRGANVILVDIKDETGEALAESIRQAGGRAAYYHVDVRSNDAVRTLFQQVQATYGGLDVLICSAGVLQGALLQPEEFPVETFEYVMDVNVKGTFLCAKYATPLLAASERGTLILIASGAGVRGGSSSIAYGTSKGAVNGMGMTLEGHLAERGIRVNVVCPGGIETELKLDQMKEAAERAGRVFDPEKASRQLGDPIGVGRLLAYLASDDGDYVRRNLFTR